MPNPTVSSTQINCLATNIYHESRGEPIEGQIAVARVTINRTKHADFPSSICGVVYQPKQFSWTIGKQKKVLPGKEWEEAKYAAYMALTTKNNFPALYYHNLKVHPKWGRPYLTRIGDHKFYA